MRAAQPQGPAVGFRRDGGGHRTAGGSGPSPSGRSWSLASLQLLWALAGLIAEPSFDFGADAATERVLGVDFNGFHALSGFLLFLPGLLLRAAPEVGGLLRDLRRRRALIVTGIWALFDDQPAWVFTFPNNEADAIFHLATGTLFADRRRDPARRDRAARAN